MLLATRTLLPAVLLTSGLLASPAQAQQADTLALAHQLTDSKRFAAATTLLTHYEQAHPTSPDALRLHLQLLYWQHQLPAAAALYARAQSPVPPRCNSITAASSTKPSSTPRPGPCWSRCCARSRTTWKG